MWFGLGQRRPAAQSAASGNTDPIKVALIPPSSGALAVFGADAVKAWQFAADEVNAKGGVDGHKVELIKSSTDAQPANTVRAARKAVTQDGAKFIGAVMTSPEHGALQQQLASMNALSFNGARQGRRADRRGLQPERVPRGAEHVDGHQRDHRDAGEAAGEDVGDPGGRLRDRPHVRPRTSRRRPRRPARRSCSSSTRR